MPCCIVWQLHSPFYDLSPSNISSCKHTRTPGYWHEGIVSFEVETCGKGFETYVLKTGGVLLLSKESPSEMGFTPTAQESGVGLIASGLRPNMVRLFSPRAGGHMVRSPSQRSSRLHRTSAGIQHILSRIKSDSRRLFDIKIIIS